MIKLATLILLTSTSVDPECMTAGKRIISHHYPQLSGKALEAAAYPLAQELQMDNLCVAIAKMPKSEFNSLIRKAPK